MNKVKWQEPAAVACSFVFVVGAVSGVVATVTTVSVFAGLCTAAVAAMAVPFITRLWQAGKPDKPGEE